MRLKMERNKDLQDFFMELERRLIIQRQLDELAAARKEIRAPQFSSDRHNNPSTKRDKDDDRTFSVVLTGINAFLISAVWVISFWRLAGAKDTAWILMFSITTLLVPLGWTFFSCAIDSNKGCRDDT